MDNTNNCSDQQQRHNNEIIASSAAAMITATSSSPLSSLTAPPTAALLRSRGSTTIAVLAVVCLLLAHCTAAGDKFRLCGRKLTLAVETRCQTLGKVQCSPGEESKKRSDTSFAFTPRHHYERHAVDGGWASFAPLSSSKQHRSHAGSTRSTVQLEYERHNLQVPQLRRKNVAATRTGGWRPIAASRCAR